MDQPNPTRIAANATPALTSASTMAWYPSAIRAGLSSFLPARDRTRDAMALKAVTDRDHLDNDEDYAYRISTALAADAAVGYPVSPQLVDVARVELDASSDETLSVSACFGGQERCHRHFVEVVTREWRLGCSTDQHSAGKIGPASTLIEAS